jgi:hypothetical protein
VVLGAGVAGLCAAAALAESFDAVTVIDRDELPPDPRPRKGVPQGNQLHLLLARGARDLNVLFPCLLRDLAAGGIPVMRDFSTLHANIGGHTQRRDVSLGHDMYLASRPFLEIALRRHLPAVSIRQNTEVLGLTGTAEQITGVRVHGDGGSEEIAADLVIDATGRSGRAVAWLAELGLPAPAEERYEVDIVYAAGFVTMDAPGRDQCSSCRRPRIARGGWACCGRRTTAGSSTPTATPVTTRPRTTMRSCNLLPASRPHTGGHHWPAHDGWVHRCPYAIRAASAAAMTASPTTPTA